ncbi:hypothetical protein J6590_027835 [Homalodisca vitripennis]|nr:hypothetical protein J6590_027835 [Homalodisca vitripennis]
MIQIRVHTRGVTTARCDRDGQTVGREVSKARPETRHPLGFPFGNTPVFAISSSLAVTYN